MQSPWSLQNKNCLITGGSKGIGRACVIEMARLGARVLFTARNPEQIHTLEAECLKLGYHVKGIVSDISKAPDRKSLAQAVNSEFDGKLHVLINNAGTNIRRALHEYSDDEINFILETNMGGPLDLLRHLYPALQSTGESSVVNVASVAASQDVRSGAPYGMSKSALLQLSRSLAVEWAPDGIRVNSVSPWYTATPLAEPVLQNPEKLNRILDRTPLGRIADAEEVARVIAFLAMPASSYVSGQNINVDGGMSISGLHENQHSR
ncbi:MAG: SDR family oxidoreductase [Bacteroidetes bacterium]|nr:MAG: SDR family oxidoreductase [Bacteroidota bacterium]